MIDELKNYARSILTRMPLVGGLAYATGKDYVEAGKEFAFIWTITVLPILFSVFIELVTSPFPPGSLNVWNMIYHNIHAGEVFIYATTLLAPVAFLMYKYNRDEIKLHNHLSFLLSVIVTIAASALMFGLQRGSVIKNQIVMDWSGLTLYSLALLVWFLSLVYDNLRLDYTKQKRDQELALTEKLKGFRGGTP